MISKFWFNFDFYKKNITTPRTIWGFQGLSHFSNKCSSTFYMKSALDLAGQFFLKMMLGDMFEWGNKKNLGEESTYPQRGTVREFIKCQSAII